jgi:hypothetical protein
MMWLALTSAAILSTLACLMLWRLSDVRAERRVWNDLLRGAGPAGSGFDPATVDGLPEPAQRYLRFAIAPGTALVSVAEIEMDGELGLGTTDAPGYRAMRARQILAPPTGLIWRLQAGLLSGSDAATLNTSWTRFWLLDLLPVVRVSGNPDHHRSAFGRVVSEGAFWVPSSLLPSSHVAWEAVDENTARARVSCGSFSQAVEVTVEADGRPCRVMIQRWSNANRDRVFREQPFGGYLSDFRLINGYRVPMHVEGGNFIGTKDYFPFYKATVRSIRFPQLADQDGMSR